MAELTDKQREKIEDGGWMHATIAIEVQGNDKDYAKDALEKMIERMEKESGVQIVDKEFSDFEKTEKDLFSYSCEIEFIAHDFGKLTRIALLYSPSYYEIHKPKKVTIEIGEAQNMLADISHIVTSLSHAVFVQRGKLRQLGAEEPKKE